MQVEKKKDLLLNFSLSEKCIVYIKGVSEGGHRVSWPDVFAKVVLISGGSHRNGLLSGFNK